MVLARWLTMFVYCVINGMEVAMSYIDDEKEAGRRAQLDVQPAMRDAYDKTMRRYADADETTLVQALFHTKALGSRNQARSLALKDLLKNVQGVTQ